MSFFLRTVVCRLLLLGWLLAGGDAGAAGPVPARWVGASTLSFVHYTDPATVGANAIAQDGAGFLWLGTQAGLVRWDGYTFRKYTADPEVPGSLPDSFVLALHTDRRGRLWVGTASGGLARFDAARDAFDVFPTGTGRLKSAHVSALADDGRGGLWVAGSGGVDHLDADGAVEPPLAGDGAATGLPDGGIQAILQDRTGTLWAGTQHGVFRRAAGATRFAELPMPLRDGRTATVGALFEDRAGRVWVGTRGDGVFTVDGERAVAVQEGSGGAALGSDTVISIVEAVPGEIWLGTYGSGIVTVGADGSTRRIRRQAGLAQSLSDDEVLGLFRDRSGLLWVASNNALSRHDPQQRTALSVRSDASRPDGLRNPAVSSVLARPDGTVWAGVGAAGIDILDPLRGRVGELRADGASPRTALPKARVLAMASGGDGEVYIGTRNGLYLADPKGRRVARVEIPGRDPAASVWSLCRDDAGLLWAGGFDGLWALAVTSPRQARVVRHVGPAQIGAPQLVALQTFGAHELWVGTDQGLVHVDTATGEVERVPAAPADPVRMPVGWVSSMLVDASGHLWLSSYGNGVLRLEGRDATGQWRFRRVGVRDGLPDAGVNKLLADRQGRIWASTDDGLAVIDARTFAVRRLHRAEGLDILAYWTESGAATADGELLFGGQGGLTVVRPEIAVAPPTRPPVVVTEARVGTLTLPAGRFDATLGPVAPLEIPPEARGLWVEFSALDFSAPEKNRYAYRLRGFNADWVATDAAHRRASYTNLPPGDYTLELRGSNRDGVWSEPPHEVSLRVLPAWYQTAWCRGAVGIGVLLLVARLVQARTVYLRRNQVALEALVAQRTADLEQRGEELRDSQRQLQQMAYADALTGLPNRRLFADDLRHQVAQAQRGGPPFVLLLIDLDGFKAVNDMHGHDAGDALLVATASRLLAAVREADRVARMGGDEFAVLLTQDPAVADVESICRRIVAGVGEPVAFEGAELQVGASIGVAACTGLDAAPEPVFKAADLALYEAKRAGRNTWRWQQAAAPAGACGPDGGQRRPGMRKSSED